MLNKIKRMNRGIILAIVSFVSLVIFIAVDEASFKANAMDDIRETVNSFFGEIEEIAVLDQQYIDKSTDAVTDEGIEKLKKDYKDLINKYMVENTYDPYGWGGDKSVMHSVIWRLNEDNRGHVTKVEFNVKKISITKEGPGMASAHVMYSHKIFTEGGPTASITPNGVDQLDYYKSQGFYSENEEDYKPYNSEMQFWAPDADISMELKKINGEWKIYICGRGGQGWYIVEDIGGNAPAIDWGGNDFYPGKFYGGEYDYGYAEDYDYDWG